MMTQIAATAFTLVLYALLALSFYGWGQAASRLLSLSGQRPESPAMPVWLGWAVSLFIFQVLHFFFPITAWVSIPVFVIGLAFCVYRIIKPPRPFPVQPSAGMVIIGVLAVGFSAWLASKAMLAPGNYDSGLYHFNSIRWINTYPVVPGLGNLHNRLAFNQSFFVYVAALNFSPFFGFGRSLANSFLVLLTFATLLPSLAAIVKRPSILVKEHPFRYAADLFALPVCAYLALASDGVASPSPDLTSSLLQLVMFVLLAHGIADWLNGQKDQDYRAAVLTVLAATAVTIKLSSLAFSAVMSSFALAYTWQTSRSRVKHIFRLLLPVIVLFLAWGLRGYVFSGVPFYPSTIGYIAFDWAIPVAEIDKLAGWVYSWARMPYAKPEDVLDNWAWLRPWLSRMSQDITNVVYPLIMAFLFFVLTSIVCLLKKTSRPKGLEWAILLPSIVSIIYWFFTAPDPRFAHASFFLLSVCSFLLLFSSLSKINPGWMTIVLMCIVLAVGNLHFIPYIYNYDYFNLRISTTGWQPVKEAPLETEVTSSGLTIYKPVKRDQCWDSPLPCTPYFNPDLRLRNPDDMSAGFTLDGN